MKFELVFGTPPGTPTTTQGATRSQPCSSRTSFENSSSHANHASGSSSQVQLTVLAGEVIETHFLHNSTLYFVLYNRANGEAKISARESGAFIQYAVKPLWYVAGTPALRQYCRANAEDETLKPAQSMLVSTNNGAVKVGKHVRACDFYRCTIGACPGNPTTLSEQSDYSLRIPSNWGQLARCRLIHCKINRIAACANMPVNDGVTDDQQNSVNAYVVCWQDEPTFYELLPAAYLENFTHHDHHHEMTLDYWEEACVVDTRWLKSAATVDYAHQNTADKTNDDDNFWVKCIHSFRGRSAWTDSVGNACYSTKKLFVNKWIGWPMTLCGFSDEEKKKDEVEEDEVDPYGFDEFIEFAIHKKFFALQNTDNDDLKTTKKAEYLSYKQFVQNCSPETDDAHVPATWRSMAEQHAEQNKDVTVLAVFRHKSVANVYAVKWPSYEHITLVPSLTLRKHHSRVMIKFFEQNSYLPKLRLLKPE